MLKELELFFGIFLSPSQKLQASTYPTLNYAIPRYLKMINKLNYMLKEVGEQSAIGIACNAALYKLNEYYTLTTNQRYSHLSVATICDPRMNLKVFTSSWPSSSEASKRNRVRAHFQDVFTQYKTRQYHLDTERVEQQTELANAAVHETDSDDDLYATQGTSFQEPEWKRWVLELRPGKQTDILKYWLPKQYMYPIVAQIARDHLAIPATSAASERAFSNGSDIITKKRNRLSPSMVRYLLCLRDWGALSEGDDSEGDGDDEWEE
jgi:hypothetical protein